MNTEAFEMPMSVVTTGTFHRSEPVAVALTVPFVGSSAEMPMDAAYADALPGVRPAVEMSTRSRPPCWNANPPVRYTKSEIASVTLVAEIPKIGSSKSM